MTIVYCIVYECCCCLVIHDDDEDFVVDIKLFHSQAKKLKIMVENLTRENNGYQNLMWSRDQAVEVSE